MKSRAVVRLLAIGAVLLAGIFLVYRYCLTAHNSRPNVLFLIIDTLRSDKLGVYGASSGASPELDQLAREGTFFEKVVAQCSWTRPSIGSMLTSRSPATLGIRKERWDVLNEHFLTLAEALKAEGYATLGITANPNINSTFHFQQGFDRYIDSAKTFDWLKDHEPNKAGHNRGRSNARSIFKQAIELAESKPTREPGYLQINIMDVHGWSKLQDEQVDPKFRSLPFGKYLQGLSIASKETAKFVGNLRAIAGWEDTLVVVVSDHGEGLGDHPDVNDSQRHGNLLYESHLLVPLILHRPADARLQARRITQPIRLLDLMPTLLDYLDIPLPPELEGISTLPLLDNPQANIPLPNYFLSETNWRNVNKVSIYKRDWLYIENRDLWEGVDPEELQANSATQNGKKTNRAAFQPQVHAELKQELLSAEAKRDSAQATAEQAQPDQEEVKQLESLGYLN